MGPLSPHIAGHIALYGSRLLHGQDDLWKTTWRSCGRFDCELGYLVNVHEYHSSRSSSSRKRLWHEFEICKESSLVNDGTAFQGNRKADQWSDRHHWHKPDQFPRFKVGIDKLIAQSSLWIFHCQCQCLLGLCALCSAWEKWETIMLNPGRSKFNGIRTTIISASWIELVDKLWNSSGRFSKNSLQWQSSMRFNRWWENYSVNQRTWHAASSFMTMFNDIVWDAEGNDELCVNNSRAKKTYAKRFPRGHWSFLDLKRRGTELTIANQMDLGIELQRKCCWISQKPIILCSAVPVPWREENSEAKKVERSQYTSMAAPRNVELLLQMVISVNHLSIYGAVADMIEELPVGREALGKPVASGQLDKQEILTQSALAEMQANEERQWNLLQEYEQRFEKLSEDQKLSRLCSEAGLRLVEVGKLFYALPSPRGKANHSLCQEYTLPRDQKRTRVKGWIQNNVRFGPVSDPKVSNKYGRYSVLQFKFNLCLKIKPSLGLELWTVLTNLPGKPCRSKRKRKLRWNPLQRRDQY